MASRSERILITGGTGFTGRVLVGRLRADGYEVMSLSHDAAGPGTNNVDLCDFDQLATWLAQVQPNVVVHLAGIAAPSHGNVDEIYRANVVGTGNLFVALSEKKADPRLIIVASSAQVYDAASANGPLTEEFRLHPKTTMP